MASEQSTSPTPEDMHWGISYLREDLQDLRQEMRSVTARIDTMNTSLNTRIDSVAETLTRRIDSRFALLLTAMIAMNGVVIGAVFAILKLHLPPQ